MAYTPHRIANAFLSLAEKDGRTLTNMQLQKLAFLAHGYTLGIFGHPLSNQPVHAFDWGPVFPNLYKALKKFGSGRVTERLAVSDQETEPMSVEDVNVIQAVWSAFGTRPGSSLSALTHQDGTPWTQVYSVSKYGIISDEIIEKYYHAIVHGGQKADAETTAA